MGKAWPAVGSHLPGGLSPASVDAHHLAPVVANLTDSGCRNLLATAAFAG